MTLTSYMLNELYIPLVLQFKTNILSYNFEHGVQIAPIITLHATNGMHNIFCGDCAESLPLVIVSLALTQISSLLYRVTVNGTVTLKVLHYIHRISLSHHSLFGMCIFYPSALNKVIL